MNLNSSLPRRASVAGLGSQPPVTLAGGAEIQAMHQSAFKRIGRHGGRILISDGRVFMTFWSARRYPTLEAIHAAIDSGAIDSGIADEYTPGVDEDGSGLAPLCAGALALRDDAKPQGHHTRVSLAAERMIAANGDNDCADVPPLNPHSAA